MSNNYFAFKQFTIQQGNCAMKVTTDACLFGAWVASQLNFIKPLKVIDIGAGTGLLSLMLAQQNNYTSFDLIEVDDNAAAQAKNNVLTSPFTQRLQVHHQPIQNFVPVHGYNLVISNPPFYENSLPSINTQRNKALHSSNLTLYELVQQIKSLVAKQAFIAVLLPYIRMAEFEDLMKDFVLIKKCLVKQSTNHHFFRVMFLYGKAINTPVAENEVIVIKDEMNNYTPEFVNLLKSYYLFL